MEIKVVDSNGDSMEYEVKWDNIVEGLIIKINTKEREEEAFDAGYDQGWREAEVDW